MTCVDCKYGRKMSSGVGCKNPKVINIWNPQTFQTRRIETKNCIIYKDTDDKFITIEDVDKTHVHAWFPDSFGCIHFKKKN